MSSVLPWLAGACAAAVALVVMLREELAARPVPTLLRTAADGAAMLATGALAVALVLGAVALAPP
ncbi:hypothetical protein, partial [Oharaeibacter diazotrophicus]